MSLVVQLFWNTLYIRPVFLLLSSFFPRLFSAVADWMSLPYFNTWCGLSANLECRSEVCSTRLDENTGSKKSPKNRHLGTIAQICRAISSQLRHVSTIEKSLWNSNLLHSSRNMANFDPLTAEIGLPVSGTPANFTGFWVLAFSFLQRRRSTEVNQTLHDVWQSPALVH